LLAVQTYIVCIYIYIFNGRNLDTGLWGLAGSEGISLVYHYIDFCIELGKLELVNF